jgi:hypothetical protein
MKEIKVIIKANLLEERKRKLNESLTPLVGISDKTDLVEQYLMVASKLLGEGYTIQEIETSDIYNKLDSVDWKGTIGSSIATTAKEYIIRFVVKEIFGGGEGFSTTVAQVLANINPLDLLKPFKDEQSCVQYFPQISDALIIALLRYVAAGQLGVDRNEYGLGFKGLTSNIAGNLFGKAIKDSNISETISNSFCKAVH